MTFAAAILLLAIGAILRYATNLQVEGINIDTVGLILMVAGAVGFVLALFQEFARRDRGAPGADPAAVEERREVREPPRR
jgi:hypothetical protein